MNMEIITVLLPLALAIIMIGLGLELTLNDFKRVSALLHKGLKG